jgi:hypothetical protein
MDEYSDLQRLLRLKRHEAPPPEYFEDFLFEFHQRQRAELLKRPLWRLALDRMGAALPDWQLVPRYAYAGGCAAALGVAGVASLRILSSPSGAELAASAPVTPAQTVAASLADADFYSKKPSFRLSELDFEHPHAARASVGASVDRASAPTRYVLDSQPVSYGQPFSF